jgi:hypothetical protein
MKLTCLIIIPIIFLLFSYAIYGSCFNFHGSPAGIYLLKGAGKHLFELKDRLQLADYDRLIAKIEFGALYERWRSKDKAADGTPYLKYSWSRNAGGGYLISFFPDGSRFLICLGRFPDSDSKPVKGIFVGGGLPPVHYENAALKTPETGAAYHDASGWHHLWGSTAEELFSMDDADRPIKPGSWEFLGSKILFSSQYQLALKSSHLVRLGQKPLKVDRYFNYHAGDRVFTLAISTTNPGNSPVTYQYSYGSSGTPIGKEARQIDLSGNYYIGLSGFRYAPELKTAPVAGSMAGFLSWQDGILPDSGYLTTGPGIGLSAKGKIQLTGATGSDVLLRWHARTLAAGQSEMIILTIGMADIDKETLSPKKPAGSTNAEELRFLLGR